MIMNTKAWWGIIIVLCIVIAGLSYALFAIPAPLPSPTATTTPSTATSTLSPLAARVIVTSPVAGATVPKTFTVSGRAPGPWYFEASFPIKVVDKDNNFIGQGIAQAQGEWMTVNDVPFTASISTTGYSGPATLVLMKDNASGMPEHDDSVSVPVTIQ